MYDEYGCAEDERRARDYEHAIANSEIGDADLLAVMLKGQWQKLGKLVTLCTEANSQDLIDKVYDTLEEIEGIREMIDCNEADGEWKEACDEARYNYESRCGFNWAGFEKEWQQ